jgi:hypothetical protein
MQMDIKDATVGQSLLCRGHLGGSGWTKGVKKGHPVKDDPKW